MANVKVRYIGNKPVKRDTVTESLAVWPGFNSVTAVPEDVAVRLCQFPDVWQLADKPVIERPVAVPAPVVDELDEYADLGDEPGDAPPASTDAVTVAEIAAILPTLDKEADFTEAGRPKIDSVRARFDDREVTVQAVKAAWENFTAGNL